MRLKYLLTFNEKYNIKLINKLNEETIYKGYPVLNLRKDAPSYKTKPEEQKKFIKNNIDKLQNKDKVFKLYLDTMNSLASDNKFIDKKINGYIIIGYDNHTHRNVVYCGHQDKKTLGYTYVELVPYGELSDIIWMKISKRPIVFKYHSDANKVLKEIQDLDYYYNVDFEIQKITLNQGYYF